MELKDKLFVITGASSGIGAATARAAAAQGARVILLARSLDKLKQIAASICSQGGSAFPIIVDLTDADAVQAMAEQVLARFGAPDILFNNAGAGRWLSTVETNPCQVVEMMAIPYFAAFYTTRAFLPPMLACGQGTIINMTSVASLQPWPGAAAYTAARWAMRGFSEALRADLYRTPLRVMLVILAKVQSEYWEHNPGSEPRVPGVQALIPVLSSEAAAGHILSGLRHDRRLVAAPFMLRLLLAFNTLSPGIARWLVCETGWRG